MADARAEARTHFKAGMDAIAAKKYAEGIAELEVAYKILPHPNVLFNIARAYADAGNAEKALEYYKRYAAENPPDKEEVLATIERLEAANKKPEPTKPSEPVVPPPPPPPPPTGEPAPPPEDVFAEKIVTASKGSQSPLEASASTAVITEQDIRLSGITKIPELLRRLAGVDIMEVTGAQTEVSIRGFNQRLSNKTLVLVDGRSVYADILGATIWQTLSIGVEDIERIEIVRGPGSSLYGSDAFNGVINIITKRPGEGKNGIAGGYGSQATTHGSLWASGREGELGWRTAAGYDYLPRWSREVPNGRADVRTGVGDQVESARTIRLDARGSRTFGRAGTLNFGGGLAQGSVEILGIGSLQDIVLPTFTQTDLTTSWTSEHFDARVFWNRLRANSTLNVNYVGQSLLPSRIQQNVVDGETVYKTRFSFSESVKNDLRVGGAYRYKNVEWSYLDHDRFEHHYSLFLHDELNAGERLAFIADYRVDWVPYLASFQQSPRGAVLVHPSSQSTMRASVATAYRKPTFLESYLRLPTQLPITGTASYADGVRRDDPNFRVNVERIFSAEVGYLNQESDRFTVEAAAYFNRVSSLIQLASNRPLTVADFPVAGRQDLSTGFFPAGFTGFENQCQAYNVYGGEAGVRTFPMEGLDVYGNYTLNLLQQDNSDCTPAQLSRVVPDQRTSQHKVNAGVQLRTKPGFDGSLDFHFVSVQSWAEQVTNFVRQQIEQQRFRVAGYALLNARVGYRFLGDHADVSVMAFNLFGVQHREHPFGQLLDRRLMLLATYKF
ncbi:MAG: TonB-dependent receptor plug domain-containing protein [Labilithrix sp.]|nr:TonB-dependent receptor plug domain-containing protein [Labilithrix sp.]MCW5817192.1 TonB-dependent receptor plug domain-containing protein [Labilithrix sp.]